ncbi:MAG: VWA domain-containing protein [Planctomycetaceae bacterium]|nr:VWA domain-containing protein [Planctomycetaceae bacterium]
MFRRWLSLDAGVPRLPKAVASVGVSVGVHIVALAILALLHSDAVLMESVADVDASVPESAPLPGMTSLEPTLRVTPSTVSPDDQESGGRAAGGALPEQIATSKSFRQPTLAGTGVSLYQAMVGTADLPGRLGEVVGAAEESDEEGEGGAGGSGTGTGTGNGSGAGTGFFGSKAIGQSVVFVVDGSRSMNRSHASPSKTRFKRLKLEIVKTVLAMPAESSFYIIFFNDDVNPMPATGMQAASDANKQRYLTWLAETTADRDTDPRRALQMALRMRPEVIYFLTDGDFEGKISRDLVKLSQRQTEIHTFAFGKDASTETMRTIAKQNRGKFHVIP